MDVGGTEEDQRGEKEKLVQSQYLCQSTTGHHLKKAYQEELQK